MAALAFAVIAFLCAVALLVVLLWPTPKRKELPRATVPAPRWPPVEL